MTQPVRSLEELPGSRWVRRFPVRTPTLPPATHTNTYVVGRGELAVIDPASPWDDEQAALDQALAAAGERVALIVLTHHHLDHASGAAHLAARLGVPVAAHRETARLLAGRLEVQRLLDDREPVRAGGATAEACFTPGHAPGHLAFLVGGEGEERTLIAGDMVASVGTIIVDPPEGDMRLYLESLERLRALAPRLLLPAHGPPVGPEPGRADELLAFYLRHRRAREERVVMALTDGAGRVEELVPRAYPDVPEAVWPLARRSLLAHLLKLEAEGKAIERDGVWELLRAGCC